MSFFVDFKNSFYNIPAYWEKMERKGGKVFMHVLMYTLLFSIATTVYLSFQSDKFVEEGIEIHNKEIPYYEFNDGELTIFDNQAYSFEEDNSFFYFDTSEVMDMSYTNDSTLDSYSTYFLIFKDGLIAKTNRGIQKLKFSDVGIGNFTKDDIGEIEPFIKRIKSIILIFAFIGILLGMLILFGIGVVFYGVIGLIINSVVKSGYTFGQLVKASAYILTVTYTLSSLVGLTGLTISMFWPKFAINIGFLILILSKRSSYLKDIENDMYNADDSNMIEGN